MTEPRVLTEIDGPVAYVWLNRPDKLNGLELDTLRGPARRGRRDPPQPRRPRRRASGQGQLVLRGARLRRGRQDQQGAARAVLHRRTRCAAPTCSSRRCWAWRELPVPVIAVTRGHVFGGGIQLALAADFRFTTPDCQWSVLEAKWGLVPDMSRHRSAGRADDGRRRQASRPDRRGVLRRPGGRVRSRHRRGRGPDEAGARARRCAARALARLGGGVQEAAQPVASRWPARARSGASVGTSSGCSARPTPKIARKAGMSRIGARVPPRVRSS